MISRMLAAAAAMAASACIEAPATAFPESGPPTAHGEAIDLLVEAYPAQLASHDGRSLIWRDGTRMAISDGVENKTPQTLVDAADIDDIFAWRYPLGAPATPPAEQVDPGRPRPQGFFLKMYGDCRNGGFETNLAEVRWVDGEALRFTRVNDAHLALEAVVRELAELGPAFEPYLSPSAGTYNCRTIAGTELRSMHAFAAAIDINTAHADYWRWRGGDGGEAAPYRNQIPMEIVDVFERHGFIWGGRWSHYDTMHFEYRPELILAARREQAR